MKYDLFCAGCDSSGLVDDDKLVLDFIRRHGPHGLVTIACRLTTTSTKVGA